MANDPTIIDGWADTADLLGYDDDAGLLGWDATPILPGQFDPSSSPLGGPVGERVYLVTATLYPDWSSQSLPSADASIPAIANHPIAGFPFGVEIAGPGPAEIRCSSRRFATLFDDPDLPSVWFNDCLIDPGSVSVYLPLATVGSATIDTSLGSVVLDNTDGAFDTVLDQNNAISQSLRIRGGRLGINVADFVTLANARITGIGLTETEATLTLQDPVLYASNLYPTSVFTGAGGAAGDAELEGVVKPVVLGRVWNMSPVLVNATALIYQAHDGALTAVHGVFDGGVALSFDADYASYAALAGASLTGGEYATCLADGLIRVGGIPAYALTAHVTGDDAAGSTIQSIATWLIGEIESQLDLTVDSASFADLPIWTVGWVWNETFTYAEAISRFVGDGGFSWGSDADGTVRALQLAVPDADAVSVAYVAADIVAIERAPMPQGYEGVHQRRQVRYLRNWTVQDDSALAGAATARAGRQREWRTALATATTSSRNSIDPAVAETSLYTAAGAEALADYLIALHGAARQMFSLQTEVFGTLPRLGDTVSVTYPRFGLAGGRVFRVISIDMSLRDGALTLLLWGGDATVPNSETASADFSDAVNSQYLPILLED